MKFYAWYKLIENAMNRWLTPAERKYYLSQGDTPFVVLDRNRKVLGYAYDEHFAARMAQEHDGTYEFDQEDEYNQTFQ